MLNLSRTSHRIYRGDARRLTFVKNSSVHLVLCSPPYFNLKSYSSDRDQLGNLADYSLFVSELTEAWKESLRVLIPGGRLVVVVGDICIARKVAKRHYVLPLHSSIQGSAMEIGFDCLTPIIWSKVTNASYEGRNSTRVYGKPWQPNAIVKNGIEYILVFRKPGPYRSPSKEQQTLSRLTREEYYEYFQPIWRVTGASNEIHPAVFPEEIATRLVRMYSFTGDTVMDPFGGSGTTNLSCMNHGRNSIYVDINLEYCQYAYSRLFDAKVEKSISVRMYSRGL